jgi:drug/metabolite transporter (DMT)-like permease
VRWESVCSAEGSRRPNQALTVPRVSSTFPIGAVTAAIGIHLLWGANPVAIKWGLEVFPPFTSGLVRFSIGALAITIWAVATGRPLWPPRSEWLPLSFLAVVFAIQIGLMNIGFGMTSGSTGAVLIALNPLFAAGFAHFLIAGDHLTPLRALGLLVAFAGTALVLAGPNASAEAGQPEMGNLILLLSAALLGGRLIGSARVMRRLDEVRAVLWMMVLGLPVFAVVAFATETVSFENMGWRPVAGIAYQGLVIAGVAFMVNGYLMRRYSPTVVTSFNFVSPVAGVGLSMWLLGETPGSFLFLGMLAVALGVTLITRRQRA